MENLLVLLDKIQSLNPLPVFTPETIVVQNAGMQHWLNLSLAQQRGISMNVNYALPAQFLWKLLRELVGEADMPEQSPFSREVLSWRIYGLLASTEVLDDDDFIEPTQYWRGKHNDESAQATLKRYQLACQMADLYEQYLIFRPEWINDWHHGQIPEELKRSADTLKQSVWQGKLWQLLVQEQSYNPVELMSQAIGNIERFIEKIPPRICFFGINAMAPIWLDFINALSQHIEIHFFHLNPCYAYWGDINSEKQASKAITNWVDGINDIHKDVGNPLLANLGQQGREFLSLLQQYSTINIDVFEQASASLSNNSADKSQHVSVLHRMQNDILSLSDARAQPLKMVDDSVMITSCHSALREVQGLHDWLLHQFNQDSGLTPKDVLVMCPQIEQYAPYVNAVFTRGWQDIDDLVPPLPCSIADRSSKDAEPLIAAFVDILNLPDSRFQVSQFITFLRIPEIQAKFDISADAFDKITYWLQQACIHWGLDQQHKANVLNSNNASEQFTWQQGFSRLMRGFAFGDVETLYQEQLLLPYVEGSDAILLGKLMLIIEQLQHYTLQLGQAKSANQWQKFLKQLVEDLFKVEEDSSLMVIYQAIDELVEYCEHAKFEDNIDLLVIRDFLDNHFSQPDPGRQFMVGQVTFCSMLPMRSIPFKIIAVLGLNDGQYPRQRQPLGFDLLDITPAKLGDRSRRGDDRYLFLEAIISARKALYLSYQGRNIRTNTEQQASLVLKELMEYIQQGYGWSFEGENSQLRQLAMQPFSSSNYQSSLASFDSNWLKYNDNIQLQLAKEKNQAKLEFSITSDDGEISDSPLQLSSEQIIRFYQHPSKVFAQQQLSLFFNNDNTELEDIEPFENDHLESYLLRQSLLADYLSYSQGNNNGNESLACRVEQTIKQAKLSGKFPELPTTDVSFKRWQEDSQQFAQFINDEVEQEILEIPCQVSLKVDDAKGNAHEVLLTTTLAVSGNKIVHCRSSSAKAKDIFSLYLSQLIAQVWQSHCLANDVNAKEVNCLQEVTSTQGFYFDTKSQKSTFYTFNNIEDAEQKLVNIITNYLRGLTEPLLLNGELAHKIYNAKSFTQDDFNHYWTDQNAFNIFGEDPYIHYFWPTCPEFVHYQTLLDSIYFDIYQTAVKTSQKSNKGPIKK